MLQPLSIAEAGDAIARMGFDGVDLTVREKGHVLPENVVSDLPPAVELLGAKGLEVGMLTTSITSSADPHAEAIFRTAAACGVKYLKLGYWLYKGFGTLRAALAEVHADLKGIERLAQAHGVTACLHTHSGHFLTADPALCSRLIEGLDPEAVGLYIDAGHIVVEGGYGVWKQGLDLVQDRIRLVAAKSFGWFPEPNGTSRSVSWRCRPLPFDKGMTDWREFFACLKAIPYDGYISIHSEYSDLSLGDLLEQTKTDLAFAKDALAAV
jgi:sugar phosphate isomerase/epimerase